MADNLRNPANHYLEFTSISDSGVLLSGYYKKGDGYRTIRHQGTSDWLITYTLSGHGEFHINSEVYRCGEGDALILPPGTPHDYMTSQGQIWEFHWAHVLPPKYWLSIMRIPSARQVKIANPYNRSRIEQAFRDMQREQYFESPYRNMLCLSTLGTILVFIAQSYEDNKEHKVDPRIQTIMNYLSSHLSEPLCLKELAEHVLLSTSRISHLFKEHTGYAIIETFLKMRLQHAANLLKYTGDSIEQIGESIGFSSIHYFSTAFKKHFGVSPSVYRKTMQ